MQFYVSFGIIISTCLVTTILMKTLFCTFLELRSDCFKLTPSRSWDSASLDKWLMDYKGGKFKKLGGQGVDGNDLLGFSEAQLGRILGNILGSVLFNLLHPKTTQSLVGILLLKCLENKESMGSSF